jgi:hypothetical protein
MVGTVNINLSSINLESLPWLPLEARTNLPELPGIYFVLDGYKTPLYIGRSANIRQRWNTHHRLNDIKNLPDIAIAWLEVSEPSLLDSVEQALIDWFDPPLNGKAISQPLNTTRRANFKLNLGIRKLLKNKAERNSRSESAQVEQFVKESEVIDRVLQKYPEIASLFLPKFNEELSRVNDELTGPSGND